ncbi:uncharacterized protein N7482_004928 [Penicillium canariense]|uniref:Uncharacterized protein n=1 Tax=Penicillium canariense TaxID=189055 RepID=A0A9W9I5N0_9EURO|nr:uncharacterized protein N7482_004928 [Penicillium canariense]KAJ5166147.1 hypothetical protein N7482_004928 [Penicillium canariense]
MDQSQRREDDSGEAPFVPVLNGSSTSLQGDAQEQLQHWENFKFAGPLTQDCSTDGHSSSSPDEPQSVMRSNPVLVTASTLCHESMPLFLHPLSCPSSPFPPSHPVSHHEHIHSPHPEIISPPSQISQVPAEAVRPNSADRFDLSVLTHPVDSVRLTVFLQSLPPRPFRRHSSSSSSSSSSCSTVRPTHIPDTETEYTPKDPFNMFHYPVSSLFREQHQQQMEAHQSRLLHQILTPAECPIGTNVEVRNPPVSALFSSRT